MVYLFTGPIRTGKTSQLMAWAKDRPGVGGFFSPDAGDCRVLCRPRSTEIHELFEVKTSEAHSVQSIGKFHFLEAAFAKAMDWIKEDLKNPKVKWLIIDEISKLELKGKGFHQLMDLVHRETHKQFIIIVRSDLLDEIVSFYNLDQATVIRPGELTEIL